MQGDTSTWYGSFFSLSEKLPSISLGGVRMDAAHFFFSEVFSISLAELSLS